MDASATSSRMELLTDPEIWIALLTLTVLEIVLGIDNIVFISILAGKLPHEQQAQAPAVGLGLAMVTRILLLLLALLDDAADRAARSTVARARRSRAGT